MAIDTWKSDPAKQILDATNGRGTDRGCVSYQCCDRHGREVNNYTMNCLVQSTKPTGGVGVVGVFVPQDPKAASELEKQGKMAFDFGSFLFKGQTIGTGQCNIKAYNRQLMNLIHYGRANLSRMISHRLGLEEASNAYRHFDARDEGWTKVVLKPAA